MSRQEFKPIPVFFTPKMVTDSGSASPSARKPEQVVASWQRQNMPISIIEPTPATLDEMRRAHHAAHVHDILACRKENGFGNCSPSVALTLPLTNGAMLSAARHALANGGAACAPCSGFHHAGWDTAEGYCTFNGLMITALTLRDSAPRMRVGILDFDQHYGNGTDDIISRLDAGRWIEHYTAGAVFKHHSQAALFLERVSAITDRMANCDIVLYQAGADPHIDDPHGGWLTTEQLRKRDALVFETLHDLKIPVVWNLAGGYQVEADGSIPKVLEIHDNTMRECVRVFG